MTATTAKNTTNSAVNGMASLNAVPRRCSSVMPVNAVISTITISPIRPTSATCKANPAIRISAATACTINAARWREVRSALSWAA
ncbi:hypothetical protein D3C72_2221010 [compost metagenome]